MTVPAHLDATSAPLSELRRPPRLAPGDTVSLVSPAGPTPPEALERAVAQLREWELEPIVATNAHRVDSRAEYLAGSDAERAADLREAWLDPAVSAVFCLRGGYGSLRVIDLLDFDELATVAPKLLIGSSDITALHSAWNTHLTVATVFGPMPATGAFLDDVQARENLHALLFSPEHTTVFRGPEAEAMVPGRATGVLVGGNVSLLAASVGAPEFRLPYGGIGLIEEIYEEPYRLDLLLLELKRSGWFSALSAIALGSWEESGDYALLRALLEEYVVPLGIPVIWQLGFGHCEGALSLPLGVEARLISEPGNPRIELSAPF